MASPNPLPKQNKELNLTRTSATFLLISKFCSKKPGSLKGRFFRNFIEDSYTGFKKEARF
jgi:hypothetical protein